MGTRVTLDEADRLHALRSCNILGTGRDVEFDRLVFTAAQLFGVPIAAVSLVTEDRLWFKAQVGLHRPEYPRANSLCLEVVNQQSMLVVEDVTAEPRFADAVIVTQEDVRFFAGAVILGPGRLPIGSFCVMDRTPRQMDPRRRTLLTDLADQASMLLLSRAATKDLLANLGD